MTGNKNFANYIIVGGAIMSGAAIPVSTAFQNIGTALLLAAFFLSLPALREFKHICQLPFPATGLFLGAFQIAGIFWTSASFASAFEFFVKFRAYYLAPIFFLIFMKARQRNYLIYGFAATALLSVVLSCLSAWFGYPIFKAVSGDWFIFRTHTYHNFFAAILGVGILSALIAKPSSLTTKMVLIPILILISYDVFFLVAGRTGQIVYFLMLILILMLSNWRLGILMSVVLIATLGFILPKYSTAFNSGVTNARADITAHAQGNSNTSLGLRMEWHENSLRLIKEKPFFGHGTGSFKGEYARIAAGQPAALLSENPHNDYLWLSVELGVLGGLLLIGLLLAAAWQGRHLQPAWQWTLYALLLGMGTSTLANSFFTDNITGLAFVLLTCALLNGPTVAAATHD